MLSSTAGGWPLPRFRGPAKVVAPLARAFVGESRDRAAAKFPGRGKKAAQRIAATGVALMITWTDFFSFCIVVISLASLFLQIRKKK